MAEIAFMSVDPDNEISDQDEADNYDDNKNVHVPQIKEVWRCIFSYAI